MEVWIFLLSQQGRSIELTEGASAVVTKLVKEVEVVSVGLTPFISSMHSMIMLGGACICMV